MHSQNKAKGPTKADSQIFLQVKIDFLRENNIFLLFQLWKQLKIHCSFAKINPAKTFLLEMRHVSATFL